MYRRNGEVASRSFVQGSSSAYERAVLVELIRKFAFNTYRAGPQ
jgi:hypothetical protein